MNDLAGILQDFMVKGKISRAYITKTHYGLFASVTFCSVDHESQVVIADRFKNSVDFLSWLENVNPQPLEHQGELHMTDVGEAEHDFVGQVDESLHHHEG